MEKSILSETDHEVNQQYISSYLYEKIINYIINDLYLNKNSTRDITYYKGLGQRVVRFCKYNNINPEFFFKQCNSEIKNGDLNFIQYITKIEIGLILEARKISNQTNNKLRLTAQKIVDKKYKINNLDEAIELVKKIIKNLNEKRAKILGFQLWNLYISLGGQKNY